VIDASGAEAARDLRDLAERPIDRNDWPYGPEILVERYIAGRELTVGVLGAVINVHWSLALSAGAVVITAAAMLAIERRQGDAAARLSAS